MSPVHSIAAPDLSIRHHHVSPTPETLFPECPDDLSPQQVAGSLVPLAGQHGSNADRATPDCPPAPVATDRPPNHSSSPVRNSAADPSNRSEEHTSELQSHSDLVCRLLLEKKKKKT